MLKIHGAPTPLSAFIWKSKAPPRVCFFAWLASKDRLQTQVNLHKKKILDSDTCEVRASEPETMSYMLFHWSFDNTFWIAASVDSPEYALLTLPWTCMSPCYSSTGLQWLHPPMLLAHLKTLERKGIQRRVHPTLESDSIMQGYFPSCGHSVSSHTSKGKWRPSVTSSMCNHVVISAKPHRPYPRFALLCFEMAIVIVVIPFRHDGWLMESSGGWSSPP